MHTAVLKMDDQQGPTLQHRELCSVVCGSLMGGDFAGNEYMYMFG